MENTVANRGMVWALSRVTSAVSKCTKSAETMSSGPKEDGDDPEKCNASLIIQEMTSRFGNCPNTDE